MRVPRSVLSAAVCALVAAPGLAMAAAGGPPSELPASEEAAERASEATPEAPPAATVDETEDATDDATDETTGDATDDATDEATEDATEDATDDATEDVDDEDSDDEGHGEAISALARCLPSGRELFGTGLTKGAVVSQAARGGEVELDGQTITVTSAEDAELVCAAVDALVASAETAPVEGDTRGQGRDDDADTDDGDDEVGRDAGRRGPPAHANAGGRGHGRR